MSRFKGKVAVITGASAGIGAVTARTLVGLGLKVVGLARRKHLLDELASELEGGEGKMYPIKADVTVEEDLVKAFEWTTKNVGPVHVLFNNAGVLKKAGLLDGDAEKWRQVMDTNVLGVAVASREAIKIMRANGIDGHIINHNSIAGHSVVKHPGLNIYPASKFALTAFSESLRMELIRLGSKIKVTNLSPGQVYTDIFKNGDLPIAAEYDTSLKVERWLDSEDVANAVVYILDTPPHVQVTEMIIRPVGETL